jgi:hypothetical protein
VEPAVGVQYTYNTTLNELMITGQNWSLVLDNPQVIGIDSQDDIDTASSSGPDAPGHFAVLTDDTGKLSIIVYPNLEAAALAADPRLQFSGTYFHPVLNTTFKLVVPIVSAEEADE